MRNNTKLKKLLEDHSVTLSMNGALIEAIVTGEGYSFLVEGKNLTDVFDRALRTLHQYSRQGGDDMPGRPAGD